MDLVSLREDDLLFEWKCLWTKKMFIFLIVKLYKKIGNQ